MENLSRLLDRGDDARQPIVQKHNVCGRASSVRSTFDGNTAVTSLEAGCVIDSIARPETDEMG